MNPTLYEPLAARIEQLLAEGTSPVLVAIDGRCGSGKSTLGEWLHRRFPQSLLAHTDDFYLPPPQRRPDWEEIPCGNMNLPRLLEEVLLPAKTGQAITYRPWVCRTKCYGDAVPLAAQPLVLVEGSYSQAPLLAGQYDLKIFVTCSREEQAARLQKREGERFADFATRWIPFEERYFALCKIEAAADLVLDTGRQPL